MVFFLERCQAIFSSSQHMKNESGSSGEHGAPRSVWPSVEDRLFPICYTCDQASTRVRLAPAITSSDDSPGKGFTSKATMGRFPSPR